MKSLHKLLNRGFFTVLSTVVLLFCAFPLTAADKELPSTFLIEDAKVFHNLIENGDWLVVYEYDIEYTTQWPGPSYDINKTFIFRLMDGTRVLGISKPYPYYQYVTGLSGYGYGVGVGSFYFSAADAESLGMEWGHNYNLRIDTNPGYYPEQSAFVTYNVSTAAYFEEDGQSANQAGLSSLLISTYSPALTNLWGVVLVADGKLNDVGQSYFKKTIPGLSNLAPSLFDISVVNPSLNSKIGTNLADQWNQRWEGTKFESDVLLKLQDKFNISWRFITTFIFLIIWGIFEAIAAIKWGNTDPGFYAGCTLFGVMATLSLFDIATAAVIAFLLILYTGYIFFGRTN